MPLHFDFAIPLLPRPPLRAAIDAATRAPEPASIASLFELASLAPDALARIRSDAERLVTAVRAKRTRAGGVDALMREFSLSSDEGVALMCLAEALLRIPDTATRDALIRDKIGGGDWNAHVGQSPSLFVNAAAWGLVVTGKLVATHSARGLSASLTRIVARGGEPLIRKGVDLAMRMLGRQFVTGETIADALVNGREMRARGFRYSYDMLGEAALTAADAERYLMAYEDAIEAIGVAAGTPETAPSPASVRLRPGISVKLSALHPRYGRATRTRVMTELLPRLKGLAIAARVHDIGLNIDAEESERLDLSLDLLKALAEDSELDGWSGLGFVIQAYQKRAPFVIDFVADLGRHTQSRAGGRQIMVRLVKGAYWDSEIKRAQVEGQSGYPVYTRKIHTDVAYQACAAKLLAAADVLYPQFATHNAYTLAWVREAARLAGISEDRYEFQCLHGMGETLYDQVIGDGSSVLACRIYAPVGSHETLLAYLVRRLLENGANSSFVNRIVDANVAIAELVADPVAAARATGGTPHAQIPLPSHLYPDGRVNSAGFDTADESALASIESDLERYATRHWNIPFADSFEQPGESITISNPAARDDMVGVGKVASMDDVERAVTRATAAAPTWQASPPAKRAAILEACADALEANRVELVALAIREAGKSFGNAIAEVREAVDFCRYYAHQIKQPQAAAPSTPSPLNGEGRELGREFERHAARLHSGIRLQADAHPARGDEMHVPPHSKPLVCISPWNFPLAIFTGQVAAALAAGRTVLAKPAEQTPLIAARAVELFHDAGVPDDVLQCLVGDGERVGAPLVSHPGIGGVLFTGSTQVARSIAKALAARTDDPVLVAETGGQNAMVVDSSALTEQVVADALVSAFDSAGQRCSALRVLCLQDEVYEYTLAMLEGALAELAIGNPMRLSIDIGPVIDGEARDRLVAHITAMRARGHRVHAQMLPDECAAGTFVAPTIIEIEALSDLPGEVFGPVLHVMRWRFGQLDALIDSINATGYGLTMGVHSRVDEHIARVAARARVGNLYVNRNIVGAVVGVQPFGGVGLSGTGPKAGGPLYLARLSCTAMPSPWPAARPKNADAARPARFAKLREALDRCTELGDESRALLGAICERAAQAAASFGTIELSGPTGEINTLALRPRREVGCVASDPIDLIAQIVAVHAVGATPHASHAQLPLALRSFVDDANDQRANAAHDLWLVALPPHQRVRLQQAVAAQEGAIVQVVPWNRHTDACAHFWRLMHEVAASVNSAAAGGNASLMTLTD